MNPMLVTLAGDQRPCTPREDEMVELLGAWNYLSIGERRKVLNEYPELMGFWATLVSGIVGIGTKVTQAVIKRVKARKAKASAKAGIPSSIPSAQEARQEAAQRQVQQKKVNQAAQNKTLLMIAAPIGAVMLFTMLKKRGKK
jgi:hypothetical protein